jgi:hypothetical protein
VPDERPPAEAGGLHQIGEASLPTPEGGGPPSDEKDGRKRYRDAIQRAVSPVLLKTIKKVAAAIPAEVDLLFFGSDDFPSASLDTLQICQVLTEAGPRIRLRTHDARTDKAKCEELKVLFFPALVIMGRNRGRLRFLGTPSGYGLQILVESLSAASTGESGLSPGSRRRLDAVRRPVGLRIFISPESEHCRRTALFGMRLAVESALVGTEVVNHPDFPVMSKKYKIGAVPRTIVNEKVEINGARDGEDFIERMLGALVAQADLYR